MCALIPAPSSCVLSGFLPTTVLGKVLSPDLDDWGQKVYSFQGTNPRLHKLWAKK